MLILVLNISGINDPRRLKRKRLLKKVNQLEVEVLCLLETRVKQPNASPIVKKWFSDWSWLENYCDAENGRVWQLWKNNWQVSQVDVSSQLFTAAMILWKEDLFGADAGSWQEAVLSINGNNSPGPNGFAAKISRLHGILLVKMWWLLLKFSYNQGPFFMALMLLP
ncbi:hypothetical protein V6N11_003765 [Hibiscus sabdariffa]|uniref:Uncharacterized protein n=1 Tax=Hibiscus sabdariffa TaxID=183260 RepID=A0ABR2SE95_9ROSI